MEPVQATTKKALRRRHGKPDRLSALPDCLLHDIMSSLKARQVLQTCVLGRLWRHLWRSVPCLNIDLDEFRTKTMASGVNHNSGSGSNISDSDDNICGPVHESSDSDAVSGGDDSSESDEDIYGSDPERSDSGSDPESSYSDSYDSCSSFSYSDDKDDKEDFNGGDKDKEWEDFQDFTEGLMHRCNIAQLDSFRLHIDRRRAPRFDHGQITGWLRRAMKYSTPDPTSQRMGLSPSPWRLRRLHLCFVALDNRSEYHVTSVFRTLEDLELDNCTCKIQSVTSHSLKSLVLKNCGWTNLSAIASRTLKTLVIDGGSNTDGCLLVILTPAVAYLHLAVGVFDFEAGISVNDMPSLVKASIHLRDHRMSAFGSYKLCGDQSKLLCSVSNAASIELSGVGRKVLRKEPTLQEFMNLRNLLLSRCNLRHDFRTLRFFLQGSPNLEKLTLQHCKFPYYPVKKKGKTKLNKTTTSEFLGLDFMCENIKVEIIYKYGDAHQLVKLLLCASGNLSKKQIKLTKVN